MTPQEAARRLAEAGVPDPQRDARRLWDWARGEAEGEAAEVAFRAAIDKRAARMPVSRIIGRRAFWTHDFLVSDAVLDPRPDTETLVEIALRAPFATVLDLGTGSGCILLSLLAERDGATGLGTDISEDALAVARQNAARLGIAGTEFRRSDWFSRVEGRFDLIVSNPPYIAAAEVPDLAPEVRFDPEIALTPGGDGLGPYRVLARQAERHLNPGGRLMVEIGQAQGAAVAALFREAGLADVTVHPDINGKDRVVVGRREGPPCRGRIGHATAKTRKIASFSAFWPCFSHRAMLRQGGVERQASSLLAPISSDTAGQETRMGPSVFAARGSFSAPTSATPRKTGSKTAHEII